MKRSLLIVIVSAIVILAGCNNAPDASGTSSVSSPDAMPGTEVTLDGGSYWRVTPAQLDALMKQPDVFLACVDKQPYIIISDNTDLFVEYDEVSQNLDKFPADKNQRIAVYCIAGITSQTASEALVSAGYTRVMHLDGGTMLWQQHGYPVINYTGTP